MGESHSPGSSGLKSQTSRPKTEGHGTIWVEPGQGSTWRELLDAFRRCPIAPALQKRMGERIERSWGFEFTFEWRKRTNLKLTGNALTDEDRERWASGRVS